MALAYPSGPTTIRLTVTDYKGKTSVKDFVVPTAVWNPASGLLTAIAAIRDNLVTAYDAIIDGLITDTFIVITEKESLILPAGNCNIFELGSVVCNISGGEGKKTTIKIPTPDDGIFVGASGPDLNVIDTSDVALNTFIDFYKLTGGDFTLSDGENLDDTTPMNKGKRISRKSSS